MLDAKLQRVVETCPGLRFGVLASLRHALTMPEENVIYVEHHFDIDR